MSRPAVRNMTKTKTNVARQAKSKLLFISERERQGPVPIHVKILNGFGAIPGQHKDFAFNTLLLLYYSQILGLPASWASLALGASLVIDAVSDPLVGSWSDNFRSRFGRRHLFILAAILPTSLSFYALFHPPQTFASAELGAWMLTFTVLTRLSFTFFAVPWAAMSAELSQKYEERTSIQTYRVAGLVCWRGLRVHDVFPIFPPTENDPSGLLSPASFPHVRSTRDILITTWMVITTMATLSQIPYLTQPTNTATGQAQRLDLYNRRALRNRNFRIVFLACLATTAIAGTGQVFDIYMNLYFENSVAETFAGLPWQPLAQPQRLWRLARCRKGLKNNKSSSSQPFSSWC